jgi:hypothetical protein
MLLPENDVLLGPVQRSPGADAPLQRAPDARADLGMAAPDLVENGDRSQARSALEQRHHLAGPKPDQRVTPPAVARRFLLRREPGGVHSNEAKQIPGGSLTECRGRRRHRAAVVI